MTMIPKLVRRMTRDVSFLYRMPAGIPGDVNRVAAGATVEPNVINSGTTLFAYGIPVALDASGIRPITTGDVAATIYGWLARPYPTNVQTANQFFGQQKLGDPQLPPVSGVCDVMKRGYMTIKVGGVAAPVANGLVYIRVAVAAAGKPIGGAEAAADGGNTIIVPNSYFRGPADANGNTEIAFNL